jgi:cell division protein FtsW
VTTVDPRMPGALATASPRGWFGALRSALDRPLTSYYILVVAPGLLLVIGLVMVLSASSVDAFEHHGSSYYWVKRQVTWVIAGLPAAWIASRLPYVAIRRLAWPALIVSVTLLALTLTPLGKTVNGNRAWLGVGSFGLQPSELAKLGLVLWAAHVYANKERKLDRLHHILVPVVPGMVLVVALVLKQRDLGTALVLLAIMLAMLWVVGAPARLFGLALSMVAVSSLYLATMSDERKSRLLNFTDPFADYHGTGWQPAHGLYALSSGRWSGQGIGASQQKWGGLPEAHTDFIFAVLGEELGLVGTLLVVGLFLAIAFAATRVALKTADPFVRYASFGIVAWLLGQMMINVGMVLALLPVIGIPLPLVSYGGSALLPSLVAIGVLIGFARREPEAARALSLRRKVRSAGLAAGTSSGPAGREL